MSRDRWSFEKTRELVIESARDPRVLQQAHLRAIEQAAVPAHAVMGDPNWRVYQQMLQGALERLRAVVEHDTRRLWSPECPATEERVLKIRINRHVGMIEAFEAAIALPKQLLESAEAAQAELAKILPEGANGQ